MYVHVNDYEIWVQKRCKPNTESLLFVEVKPVLAVFDRKDTIIDSNQCLLIVISGEQIVIFVPFHRFSTHLAT